MTVRDITNSPVSLRILIACMLFVGSGVWAAAVSYKNVTNSLEDLSDRLSQREKNGWTVQEERAAWKEYATLNPGAQIPNIKLIHEENRN